MASGGLPRRRLTENDREVVGGALALALVAIVVAVAFYWIVSGPTPGAR